MKTILEEILEDVRTELAAAKAACPAAEIRSMLGDAPPVREFAAALRSEFRLIAEIKRASPSVGVMRTENVETAPSAYEAADIVAAVSILTNQTHFKTSIADLAQWRKGFTKPVLRKDFIVDEYQIRQARAHGADAVLLMASVLDRSRLAGYYDLARELGMEVLFEVHDAEEIALLPPDAAVVGINSRKFKTRGGFSGAAGHAERDFTVDLTAFELAERLPSGVLRVAESGLSPGSAGRVVKRFHAALVGTALLRDERGVEAALADFQRALAGADGGREAA